jgi:uncharacterized protein YktB (UPF0637 family)
VSSALIGSDLSDLLEGRYGDEMRNNAERARRRGIGFPKNGLIRMTSEQEGNRKKGEGSD